MKTFILGLIIGASTMAALAFAGDYLHPSDVQSTLGEIRVREALETVQFLRQRALDEAVHNAGKAPCR